VDKRGKPLNDCAMNRQRNLVMTPEFFQTVASGRIAKAVGSAAKLEAKVLTDFSKEAKNTTSKAIQDLDVASKLQAATSAELSDIAKGCVEELKQHALEASSRLLSILEEATAEVQNEGGAAGLSASRETYGDRDAAQNDPGVAVLREYIAVGQADLAVSSEKVTEQLGDQLKASCEVVNARAAHIVSKLEHKARANLEKNQRKQAAREKKQEMEAKKAAEREEKKRKAAEREEKKRKADEAAVAAGAAAAEGTTQKKKRGARKAVECDNSACMVLQEQGEGLGWLKCQKSKKCKRHYCPACQENRVKHEAVCRET
jgi:hypothetical protein